MTSILSSLVVTTTPTTTTHNGMSSTNNCNIMKSYGSTEEHVSLIQLDTTSISSSDTMIEDSSMIHEGVSSITESNSDVPPPPPPPPPHLPFVNSTTNNNNNKTIFVVGSVPHSVCVAITIGIACGTSAYVYNEILQWSLTNIWKVWSKYVFELLLGMNTEYDLDYMTPYWTIIWIPIVALVLSIGLGYTVRYVGEPGDLASTIYHVHSDGWIELNHALPMTIASLFSIVAGSSVGPEAALVAICATLAGFVSQSIFGIDPKAQRNIVRKHTLMGMAGALAAFFGSPLGGSLFALEVCSRFGVEYYEHTLEAILCGEITLTVFRTLSQIPPSSIWNITMAADKLTAAYPVYIFYGAMIGLIGAIISSIFGYVHKSIVMATMSKYHLLDPTHTVTRALVGAAFFVAIGIVVPQTFFWSEEEFQNIATMDSISNFPHVWPAISLTGFEMRTCINALVVGVAKLTTISFSIAGGFRGGVIFPLFASGSAFGRVVHFFCPYIPVQICVLCFAAAIQVPITRTALSTSIILTYLSGEPQALAAILAASLVSLFCTVNVPVLIMTQVPRLDLNVSIHHHSLLTSPIIVSNKTVHSRENISGNSNEIV